MASKTSEAPQCPKPDCGAPMRRRMARRGKNAGNEFWGCSRYPKCKGTRDISNDGSGIDKQSITEAQLNGTQPGIPLNAVGDWLVAQGFDDGLRVLLQGAGRRAVLDASRGETWSHTCAVLPPGSVLATRHDPRTATVLHVVERVLTRGRFPPLDAASVADLPSAGGPRSIEHWSPRWKSPDGSAAEEAFFRLASELLGTRWAQHLHPQVALARLVGSGTDAGERVDFAVMLPSDPCRAVVIEIDGSQHEDPGSKSTDEERDARLRGAGHTVIRLPASGAGDGWSDHRQRLTEALERLPVSKWSEDPPAVAAAQAAVTCLFLIRTGVLSTAEAKWRIRTSGADAESVAVGCRRFLRLYNAVAALYGAPGTPECAIGPEVSEPQIDLAWESETAWYACAETEAADGTPRVAMRPLWLPGRSALEAPSIAWVAPSPEVDEGVLETLLQMVFPDKQQYWEGQLEGVQRCLAGDDSLVLLPTGAGKSLIYQLSAVLMPGMTIVVCPLISLMEDQADNLARSGIGRAAVLSSATTAKGLTEQLQRDLAQGPEMLCYVSPERMQIESFRAALYEVARHMPIPIVVVDEAHCVSEWGHDFRPAYLMVGRMGRRIGRRGHGQAPSIVGLTGTASRAVLRDVQRELRIEDLNAVITPENFDRGELTYEVHTCRSDQKTEGLRGILAAIPQRLGIPRSLFWQRHGGQTNCGLVFTPHVKGRFGVLKVADELRELGVAQTGVYAGSFGHEKKSETAKSFKDDDTQLLVATKAFGMGIDKPNVRFTIHYGFSSSLEALWQEMGRAGRDRAPAHCVVLASVDDEQRARSLLSPDTDVRDVAKIMDGVTYRTADDVTRALWFHVQSFTGVEDDIGAVRGLLDGLEGVGTANKCTFIVGRGHGARKGGDSPRKRTERALHRLIVLGVCDDYTVDFKNNTFNVSLTAIDINALRRNLVDYVRGYSRARAEAIDQQAQSVIAGEISDAVLAATEILVTFVYETVELSRRTAIRQVWDWCERGGTDDHKLRTLLIEYLQETEFSRELRKTMSEAEFDLERWRSLHEDVRSKADLKTLGGALRRTLEDRPDHPLLLCSIGIVQLRSGESIDRAGESFRAAARWARERYAGALRVRQLASWCIDLLRASCAEHVLQRLVFELAEGSTPEDALEMWRLPLPLTIRLGALPAQVRRLASKSTETRIHMMETTDD